MKKLIVALLLSAILVGCAGTPAEPTESTVPTSESTSEPTTESATEPTTELAADVPEIVPGYGNNAATDRVSYAVSQAAPTDENMSNIIAIDPNSAHVYDNTQLQIAFWTEYQNFVSSYSSYLSYFGLDTTLPLSEQEYEPGKTWEQYFLESAISGLEQNYALAQYAAANGYELSEEDKAVIESITATEGDFYEEYTAGGFASADEYIQTYFGKGTDAAAYQEYNRMYFAAADCYYAKVDELTAALSEEDVLAHYEANADNYAAQGILKCNNINVRHILIQPEGEESTWTDETWKAAEQRTQEIYDEWCKNPTEEAFATLAGEVTQDPGSAETGGLYEDVAPGDMVTEFNDWCFDAGRQVGDHGIVKTSYGYHIMYFVGQAETRKWYETAQQELLSAQLEAFIEECLQTYPLSFDYSLMFIYDLLSEQAEQPKG